MKYTVIIPTYNVEEYIERTIKSVLSQTYKNIEIILINDGSTDGTIDVLKSFEKKDDRIIVIDKVNGGVSSARNVGIDKSSGDYLYFLDGDDVIESTLFQKIFDVLNSKMEIDFISFGYKIIEDSKVKSIFSHKEIDEEIFTKDQLLLLFLKRKLRQSMCSFVVKKSIVTRNYIRFDENTTNGEDQEFQMKCMYHSKYSYYSADVMFTYLQRSNSAISKFSIKYLTLLTVFERLFEYIEKKDQNVFEYLKLYALYTYFYVLKKAVKNDDQNLIKIVINNYKSFDYKVKFEANYFVIKTIVLKLLFSFSPELLIGIFKKV